MTNDWQAVVERPKLADGEVQVWRLELEPANAPEEKYLALLNAEELERSSRLRSGQVRKQFLAGRAFARELLAAELKIVAKDVPIVTSKYGKPELAGHTQRIHFNVAHTRSTVVVAISRIGPIGIDVEYHDRTTDVLGVARHSLTDLENTALLAIADVVAQRRAFFASWTRKEAVVKADGRGLSLPMTSFEVPLGSTCVSVPIEIANAAGGPGSRFFLSDLAFDPQTACAIAIANRSAQLRLFSFAYA